MCYHKSHKYRCKCSECRKAKAVEDDDLLDHLDDEDVEAMSLVTLYHSAIYGENVADNPIIDNEDISDVTDFDINNIISYRLSRKDPKTKGKTRYHTCPSADGQFMDSINVNRDPSDDLMGWINV